MRSTTIKSKFERESPTNQFEKEGYDLLDTLGEFFRIERAFIHSISILFQNVDRSPVGADVTEVPWKIARLLSLQRQGKTW
jgi:hypothetical protein